MGDSTVNGDMPHSSTLSVGCVNSEHEQNSHLFQHIASYPVVSDSLKAIQEHPYGAKAIDLTNHTYANFVKPAFPYLQTPVSYASPYIAKADEIGDHLLSKVDEKVPIVKKETADIKGTVWSYVHWPVEQADEAQKYVFGTWTSEYKKCGGDGVVAGGKAMVTSGLVITSDVLTWLSNYLSAKKAEMKETVKENTN